MRIATTLVAFLVAGASAAAPTTLSYDFTDEAIAVPSAGTLLTSESQPGVMDLLEHKGRSLNDAAAYGFGEVGVSHDSTASLYAKPWFKSVIDSLVEDIRERKRASGGHYEVRLGEARIFDYGHLKSNDARFDLVAVVNRIDRRDFYAEKTCGELRLIYRLRYEKARENPKEKPSASRVPFSFNLVFRIPDDKKECTTVRDRWKVPSTTQTPEAYASWLAAGPASLSGLKLLQLEVNAQVMRLPSEVRREHGGHAEYFLRIFQPVGHVMELKPLENTPDAAKINADANLKQKLWAYVTANLSKIDLGTFQLPDEFLAKKVSSVSTHGLFRMENRAFSRIFNGSDKASFAFAKDAFDPAQKRRLVNSREGVLARLDDATCSGCHQGNSIAGFHLIGLERLSKVHPFNATRRPASEHFADEQARRLAYLNALSATVDTYRPVSFLRSVASAGDHCLAATKDFAGRYGCESDSTCKLIETNASMPIAIGTCVRKVPAGGDLCLGGAHTSVTDASNDVLKLSAFSKGVSCESPKDGTPGGMITGKCTQGTTSVKGAAICGLSGGTGFDTCAFSGDFSRCLGASVKSLKGEDVSTFGHGIRSRCDDKTGCRDDYICQRLSQVDTVGNVTKATLLKEDLAADGHSPGPMRAAGSCIPTYFLFQLRADGHLDSKNRWLDVGVVDPPSRPIR